jgi:hypothetical protein
MINKNKISNGVKRFLPYILIIAMILSGVSLHFLFAPKEAEAVLPIIGAIALWKVIAAAVVVVGAAWYFGGVKIIDMTLGKMFTWISGFIFSAVSIFLSISGYILDYAVEKTVSGEFFNISAIGTGWAVSRDVANLFFIFILLYIAIATILQLSNYGMKTLLAKLVIVALLVNFSLVITKMIIDVSNVLAREFYSQLKVETIAPADGTDGGMSFKKGDKIIVNSPSMVFMNAIQIQTIFTPDKFKTLTPGAGAEQKDDLNNFKITMIYLGGTIVVLVTTFVFFAMAILLIIRVVTLIILMILAPLAFLFMILPKTKQYADQWWETLFKQSFFAPALMFFVYLSANIISDPKFAKITDSGGTAFADAMSGNPSGFSIIFSFIIIIALMIASLIVAQKMGAVGAGAVQSWGKSAAKWGRGVAGRNTVGRVSRAAAQSQWAQTFAAKHRRFGGGIMLRTLQRGAKVGGLDKITEAKINTGMSLSSEQRAEYLRNLDRRTQEEIFKRMSARERVEAKEKGGPGFDKLYALLSTKLSAEEKEKTEKTGKEVERKNIVNNLETSVNFTNDIKQVRPNEIKELKSSLFDDPTKIVDMVNSFSAAHIKELMERGDKSSEKFFQYLTTLGLTSHQIAQELKNRGNASAAAWIMSGPGATSYIDAHR